jgi:hypothetical protein
MEGGTLVADFSAQMSNWRVFYWGIFSFSMTAPKWSHANFIIASYRRSTWITLVKTKKFLYMIYLWPLRAREMTIPS